MQEKWKEPCSITNIQTFIWNIASEIACKYQIVCTNAKWFLNIQLYCVTDVYNVFELLQMLHVKSESFIIKIHIN